MRRILSISLFLLIAITVNAQDLHFTQFYRTPLSVNPAETGNFGGLYRFGGNYRDQWRSVTVPYQSFSTFADFSIQPNKVFPGDRFGFGAIFLNDQAGDGQLTTTKIVLSTAYHKSFNKQNTVMASVGFGVGFIQKKIDFSNLTFDSQWNDFQFDPSLGNNEANFNEKLNYIDFQAGIILSFRPEKGKYFHFGAALHHLNTPNESFYNGQVNELGLRPVFKAGGKFKTGLKGSVQPGIFFATQKKAREIIIGSNYAFRLDDRNLRPTEFLLGGWFRYADAIVGNVGVNFKGLQVMASYDFNISKLSTASKGLGGFELSLIYVDDFNRSKKSSLDCPEY